jgi:hypothetical protein
VAEDDVIVVGVERGLERVGVEGGDDATESVEQRALRGEGAIDHRRGRLRRRWSFRRRVGRLGCAWAGRLFRTAPTVSDSARFCC